jgi:hypothetical protein
MLFANTDGGGVVPNTQYVSGYIRSVSTQLKSHQLRHRIPVANMIRIFIFYAFRSQIIQQKGIVRSLNSTTCTALAPDSLEEKKAYRPCVFDSSAEVLSQPRPTTTLVEIQVGKLGQDPGALT